jgi:hypothetical protein
MIQLSGTRRSRNLSFGRVGHNTRLSTGCVDDPFEIWGGGNEWPATVDDDTHWDGRSAACGVVLHVSLVVCESSGKSETSGDD